MAPYLLLDNAFNVGAFAAQHGLSSLSFWSLNRDNPSNLDYVDSESNNNPEQRVTGEYTRSFLAGALNVPLPTLPDVLQVVDTHMKTQPVDITSSPHWRAKEIEASVASALPPSTPAVEEPAPARLRGTLFRPGKARSPSSPLHAPSYHHQPPILTFLIT